ncbi:hypothetical protein ABZ079_03025 [Streptomyces sp. NPDC006314]
MCRTLLGDGAVLAAGLVSSAAVATWSVRTARTAGRDREANATAPAG